MAGDWMKVELELPDKPEVHAIAGTLGIDSDLVVGKLLRVWQWFDKHTTDGNAYGVTFSLLDRITGVTGFGEAMMFAGWLEQNDKVLTMPKFDRHTSSSAKSRALTRVRVEKLRNAPTVTDALPEKRREEKILKPIKAKYTPPINGELLADWLKVRKAKRSGELTETAFNGLQREARLAGITDEQAVKVCCERSWQSFKAEWYLKKTPQGNRVQEARQDVIDQIWGGKNGANRQAFDIESLRTIEGDGASVPKIPFSVRESDDC